MVHQTKLDVVNVALGRLGEQVLNDYDEQNATGRTVRRFWDQARQEVLRVHDWNFAIKRAKLPELATAPLFNWENAYQLPNDFLRLVSFNGIELSELPTRFEIEGDQLLTDQDTAQIRYVYDVEDIARWDSLSTKALAIKLAADMAMTFKSSVTLLDRLTQEYEGLTAQVARRVDANESRGFRRRNNYPIPSDLVDQRLRGTSIYTRFLEADPAD